MRQCFHVYIVIIFSLASITNANATNASCVMNSINKEAAVTIDVQDEISKFIISKSPELREITSLYTNHSKLVKQRRVARIGWILKVEPKRFTRPDQLYALAWSEKDDQDWIAASLKHKELNDETETITEQLTEHPDRDELKQFLQENMRKIPLLNVLEDSGNAIQQIRENVKACF